LRSTTGHAVICGPCAARDPEKTLLDYRREDFIWVRWPVIDAALAETSAGRGARPRLAARGP
jgi:hypothetical protein